LATLAQPRGALPGNVHSDASHQCISACPACELGLCAGKRKKAGSEADDHLGALEIWSSVQTTLPRRTIYHPSKYSDFVSIICSGWASSSVALPDGRRQVLSFLLPGDIASLTSLFDPVSGRLVEAITNVTYRNFKREELKAALFGHRELFEKLAEILIEERKQIDQLAADLGRRTADERLARLILNLSERLEKRGMVQNETMEFPLRQWQIADATGLTPVHVSKVLGEFQRAKLIDIEERLLTILNRAELRRVADRSGVNVRFPSHPVGLARAV
jgi:CRP/FNR family transcriptional regulator